jgi:hypothetical protein
MTRFIGLAGLALAVLVLALPAVAAAPATDSAQGAGSVAPGTCVGTFCLASGREFSFSAKAIGFGGHATGTYHQSNLINAGPGVTGDVTCLNVLGNFASFGGVITQAAGNPAAVGLPFVVYVADNGPADSGLDLISPLGVFASDDPDLGLLPAGFPRVCPPAVPSLYGYFPVSQGNIVVTDESPAIHG